MSHLKSAVRLPLAVVVLQFISAHVLIAQDSVPDDRTITFLVGESLREDPRVSVADIDITTDDGVVTLKGSVTSLIQVRYAALIAKKVVGVRGVINRLVVRTTARPDEAIADDVSARIERNSASAIQDLRIQVKSGKVFLAGEAPSFSVGLEAALSAAEVQGVIDVSNNITIVPPKQRPDREVAIEILGAFERDVFLTNQDIKVAVDSGVVTLQGTVGSAFQKQRAKDLAWKTANVLDVVNDLQINWLQGAGERVSDDVLLDEQLEDNVLAQLKHDPRVDPAHIDVTAKSGHVTLRGHVPSVAQRQIAEADTRDVIGATWVTNLLTVRTSLRADSQVERDVAAALKADVVTRRYLISARATDGIVSLSGTVDSLYPKYHASQVAGRVPGVRSIRNDIYVRLTTHFRDNTLEGHLQTRLKANWATAKVASRIKVKATNGRIILSGDVDTFAQRREAARMAALMSGVIGVQNRLTVKGVDYPWEDWNDVPAREDADEGWRYRGDFFERPGVARG